MRPGLICRFPPEDKKGLKIDPGVEASFSDVSKRFVIPVVRFPLGLLHSGLGHLASSPATADDVRGWSPAHLRTVIILA
jgi:hypothetical protein